MSETDTTDVGTGRTDRDSNDGPLLEAAGLKKYFDQSDGMIDRLLGPASKVKAVDGVDFELGRQETVAVVGESGCGKSTLGKTLLNLHDPTGGEVRLDGTEIGGLSDKEMLPYRKEIQMIFQDPLASLNPRQTVGDIIKAPLEVHGIGEDDADRTERVRSLLDRVGLSPDYLERYPHQFSGGQQQRIGIARALALEPRVLIADEPVSALDVSVQAQILNLLSTFQEEFGLSILFITHDLSVVRYIADRVLVMYLGEIVESAPVDELFESPQHPYTQSLLSSVPRIDPEERSDRITLRGVVPSPMDPPSGCRFHTRCPVVIPPEDWPGTEEAFRFAFRFRNQLLSGEIDVENIETHLEATSGRATTEAVANEVIADAYPGSPADLPEGKRDAIESAATALVEGDEEEAGSIVSEAFPSPCERRTPTEHRHASDHAVRCHRLDPSAPGRPQRIGADDS
ncbi:peptide ABC transporter ATP-binding protein [Halorubrum sp. 48-1-W]|uniref:ABC transporter ATP-binding protein n=1 Tax=Halorubrum sp. 48-1-W TaxID=2249761 RepID=UPI000DCAF4D7|nr:oligopeptide/dipeptide ABC transporter ATP-binding protein [Halorubrum sp. 48-1-W]RAW46121.1 peptide ABC transporter ATP-binding protein [Halorubrum sp. 48-1-W]